MRFLIRWLVNVIALLVVIHVIAGVSIDSMQTVFIAALILGLLNAFIKPVLVMLTLPFTIVTLGIFTLFINGFIFYIAAKFIKGFAVTDFWSAFWAAILFSIISSVLSSFLSPSISIRYGSFRPGNKPDQTIGKGDFIDVEGKVK